MKFLLDTNTCIGWLRQNQAAIIARLQAQLPTDIVLCSVVVGELLFGVERSAPAHRANTALRVEQLRQMFVSLPFDSALNTAAVTGQIDVRHYQAEAIS